MDAYQQALSRAGYSFRRIGDDEVLTDDEFRKDVANNSTETLMSVLDDFEVVVTPGRPADSVGDLVVHMITYGYAVDYDFGEDHGIGNPPRELMSLARFWMSRRPIRFLAILFKTINSGIDLICLIPWILICSKEMDV